MGQWQIKVLWELPRIKRKTAYSKIASLGAVKINDLKTVHHSNEKVESPFLSNISKTMPPPLATHVNGSSAM